MIFFWFLEGILIFTQYALGGIRGGGLNVGPRKISLKGNINITSNSGKEYVYLKNIIIIKI